MRFFNIQVRYRYPMLSVAIGVFIAVLVAQWFSQLTFADAWNQAFFTSSLKQTFSLQILIIAAIMALVLALRRSYNNDLSIAIALAMFFILPVIFNLDYFQNLMNQPGAARKILIIFLRYLFPAIFVAGAVHWILPQASFNGRHTIYYSYPFVRVVVGFLVLLPLAIFLTLLIFPASALGASVTKMRLNTVETIVWLYKNFLIESLALGIWLSFCRSLRDAGGMMNAVGSFLAITLILTLFSKGGIGQFLLYTQQLNYFMTLAILLTAFIVLPVSPTRLPQLGYVCFSIACAMLWSTLLLKLLQLIVGLTVR